MTIDNIRNIAIIAHVDHGKTTLVDKLLRQSGALNRKDEEAERIMDSNDQEKERGITILAKNTAIQWRDCRINIIDTPGHADFGGEVERALAMADSVLLLVDAADGPMPQTRFVTAKAFARGLHPIVVINKIDRPGARPEWAVNQIFDLFDYLGATDAQLDFPIIYASALNGVAGFSPHDTAADMTPLFETIIAHAPPPNVTIDAPFQMQITALDYNNYVGVIGIGRITAGVLSPNQQIIAVNRRGEQRRAKILQVMGYRGLERVATDKAVAGDIVCITGVNELGISDTLCAPESIRALPPLAVDEPTVSMTFQVNDSPFAGRDGKFITSRNLKERLQQELLHNVALTVEPGDSADKFKVSGRGELHLSVLIETMRREGYELGVSRPQVIRKEIDGALCEPFESIIIDMEEKHQGGVMEELGVRKAAVANMTPDGKGRVKLECVVPARGLIGFRGRLMTLTSGGGIMSGAFSHYAPLKSGEIARRLNGVLVSMVSGKTLSYGLFNLQERGRLFWGHGVDVYEGQIVGAHSRSNDLAVNPTRAKQLTNVRASGTDEALTLIPPIRHTLEQALAFIEDDELVEVTPKHIRLRKKLLSENARKRARNK